MAGTSTRGERIQVTGGQPAEAAVAEAGFLLLLDQVVEVQAEFRHGLAGGLGEAEVEQVVGQMRAGQKLGGEVGHHARVLLGVGFHGADALAAAPGRGRSGPGRCRRR